MTAPLLSPLNQWVQREKLKNWSGNLTFSTDHVFYPQSVNEAQELVKKCSQLRSLGTRHCFNPIADSKYNLISSKNMNKVVELDALSHTVTVESGIKYGELSPYLHEKGFALHNLASLPHISVAGSITTATHGSGVTNGNLATAVKSLEFVRADGTIMHLSRGKDAGFPGAVVGLGALGFITRVGLAIQPTYMMRQNVFIHLPMAELKEHFEQIVSAGYSVSLFTDWRTEYINEVWIKSKVDPGIHYEPLPEFYGAKAATKNLHPIIDLLAENCTEQMGVPGPWYERLPHFKMGFTPSSGKELQSEYFVPRHHAVEAITAVSRLNKQISPHLLITEIRTIDADDLWMSPCRNQASVTIHFTWKPDWPAVSQLLPLIEKELSPFNARPHWGKLFTMSPRILESRYEKLEDFKRLVATYDPKGKFRNEFLKTNVYANA
ncbi:MAG: FAD-binding protein [Chitinophagales bacterium]